MATESFNGRAAAPKLFHGPATRQAWGIPCYGGTPLPCTMDEGLIEAVKMNSFEGTKYFLSEGANPNFQDEDGMTSLHHAAARACRSAFRLLIGSGKCDYLIPDSFNRYPSDLAIEWGRDYAVARLLTRKRLQQANVEGVSARCSSTMKLIR